MILLPFLTFVFGFRFFLRLYPHAPRHAFLVTAVLFGAALTDITEELSLLSWLTPWGIAIGWWILGFLALLAPFLFEIPPPPPCRPFQGWSHGEKFLLILIVVSILPSFLVAILAPPNNIDSLEYHMPRVLHWLQNASVAFYPTHDLRQIGSAPWAEYAMLHLYALWGSDRFVNLVQWFSMVGCLIGGSLLAAHFGASRMGQLWTALAIATIPMGILQSSSTQTDYVVTFWLLAFGYFALRFVHSLEEENRREGERTIDSKSRSEGSLGNAIWGGLSLGLALLTKGTTVLIAPPIILLILLRLGRKNLRRSWRAILLAAFLACLLNLGYTTRSLLLFRHPLGAVKIHQLDLELHTPQAYVSNFVRHLYIHLKVNFNPYLNPRLQAAMEKIHAWLDLLPNDPRTTWAIRYFPIAFDWTAWDENEAGSPLHALLAFLAFLWSLGHLGRKRLQKVDSHRDASPITSIVIPPSSPNVREEEAASWILSLFLGLLFFVLLLKWSELHARHHLTLLVLAMPVVGMLVSRTRRHLHLLLALFLFAFSIPVHLFHDQRPLVGKGNIFTTPRKNLFLQRFPEDLHLYEKIAHEVREKGIHEIGLRITSGMEEYLYWVALWDAGVEPLQVRHVLVENESQKSMTDRDRSYRPGAIFSNLEKLPETFRCNEAEYRRTWNHGDFALYLRSDLLSTRWEDRHGQAR